MFRNILVVGAGTMGIGIATLFAVKGFSVTLLFNSAEKIASTESVIKKQSLRHCKQLGIDFVFESINNRIIKTTAAELVGSYDFIIEAITECLVSKKALFQKLSKIVTEETIWATNTSSFSITDMAASYKYPSKFIGMHFFNPVSNMELVEVIPGLLTEEIVLGECLNLCQLLQKVAVRVDDSPGFIVNRLLIPMINEAVCLLEAKVASVAEIDNAMKLGAHHPLGPLALADLIGNDVCLSIMQTLYTTTCDSKYRPAFLLQKMVSAGKLGRKTGQGFYNY